MILLLKALLIALACLLALAIIIAGAIIISAAWAAKGDYSIGAEADGSGICHCPDCVNHSGLTDQARAVSTPAPCVERTSQLLTPNS